MKTHEYIDQMEQLFKESFSVPLSNGKILVDSIFMQEILEDLKKSLPKEFEQAQAVVKDRNSIIGDARREADIVMKNAEEQANFLVCKDAITRGAEEKAALIIEEAKKAAEQIIRQGQDAAQQLKFQADEYAAKTVKDANTYAAEIRYSIENAAANLASATSKYSEQMHSFMSRLMESTSQELRDVQGKLRK